MNKTLSVRATIRSICVFLLMVCGTLVFIELSYFSSVSNWDYGGLVADSSLRMYILGLTAASLLGVLVAAGLRSHSRRRKIIAILPSCILLILWGYSDFRRESLQRLFLLFWPLVMWYLANKIITHMIKRGRRHNAAYFSAYYVMAIIGAALLLWYRAPWLRFEPIQITFLIFSAHAALWSIFLGEDYRKEIDALEVFPNQFRMVESLKRALFFLSYQNQQMHLWRTRCAVGATAFVAALFFTQERGQAFLFGRRPLSDWLRYRCQVFLGNLQSDFSAVDEYFQDLVLLRCPVSRIHAVGGVFAALTVITLVLSAFLMMFVLLRIIPASFPLKSLCSTLVHSLMIRSILGFLADVFVITTTNVHVLLLNQPWDLFSVVLLIALALQVPDETKELPDTVKLPWSGLTEVGANEADETTVP